MEKTTPAKLKEQKRYVRFIFDEKYHEETPLMRYERLLKEFDHKLALRLNELRNKADHQLDENTNSDPNAKENYEKTKKYIQVYSDTATELKKRLTDFSDKAELYPENSKYLYSQEGWKIIFTYFFSKDFYSDLFLNNYADHKYLAINGYPNIQFKIELLARVTEALDNPNNKVNHAQLLLLQNILPDASYKPFITILLISWVLIFPLAVTAIVLPGPGTLLLCLIVPATLALGLVIKLPAIVCVYNEYHNRNYEDLKDDISAINARLSFFSKNINPNPSDTLDSQPDFGSAPTTGALCT